MKRIILSLTLFIGLFTHANAQNVNIPDANFKSYLVGNTLINTNADTEIQLSEAQAFSGAISCFDLMISDLTGIEAFTNLTSLNCNLNNLTTLDLTSNTALVSLSCNLNNLTTLNLPVTATLTTIQCSSNGLTVLDVSNLTGLQSLYCEGNSLTSVDVSNISGLTLLSCYGNPITSIDVSGNALLTSLNCQNTQLTSLNIANGNNTNFTYIAVGSISSLSCVQVDDEAYSNANWTGGSFIFGPGMYFSEDCSSLEIEEWNSGITSIFPNPSSEEVNIVLSQPDALSVMNVNGAIVQTSAYGSIHKLNISQLDPGVYFIYTESGSTNKFIKH